MAGAALDRIAVAIVSMTSSLVAPASMAARRWFSTPDGYRRTRLIPTRMSSLTLRGSAPSAITCERIPSQGSSSSGMIWLTVSAQSGTCP